MARDRGVSKASLNQAGQDQSKRGKANSCRPPPCSKEERAAHAATAHQCTHTRAHCRG